MVVVAFLLIAYLLGSIPTGFLIAKWIKHIDIRQHGSGGTGATNVLRTVGKSAAVVVLLIDLLKGALAVSLVKGMLPVLAATSPGVSGLLVYQAWLAMAAGLLAMVGHSRSIWINFTGGKSVASGLGVLLALAWPVGLGAILAFVVVLASTRIVSLGSIVAALVTSMLMFLTGQPLPYGLLGIAGGCYVLLRHRSNIERLLAGTEPRIGEGRPSNQG